MATRSWRAFTLIELLVVVAIVALLMSFLLPALRQARDTAKRVNCMMNLRQVDIAIALYASANEQVFPAADDPIIYFDSTGQEQQAWLWMGRGMREMLEPYLRPDINESSPSVLLCPSDVWEDLDPSFERTSYAYSLAFYHSPEQMRRMNTPLSIVSSPQPPEGQNIASVTFPHAKILSGDWDRYHEPAATEFLDRTWDEKGWWDVEGERNYLFADGHIESLKTAEIQESYDGLRNPNLTVNGIRGRDK